MDMASRSPRDSRIWWRIGPIDISKKSSRYLDKHAHIHILESPLMINVLNGTKKTFVFCFSLITHQLQFSPLPFFKCFRLFQPRSSNISAAASASTSEPSFSSNKSWSPGWQDRRSKRKIEGFFGRKHKMVRNLGYIPEMKFGNII